MTTILDPYRASHGGGSNIEGGSCQLHFQSTHKMTKNASKKVTSLFSQFSQSEQNMYFCMLLYCAFYMFSKVQNYLRKRDVDFSFGLNSFWGQAVVMSLMSLYTFLDNHYRGYQYLQLHEHT